MKTIQASRPVANPQQFTRLPSNPLLESAQRQMELAEEVKRQKEMARRNSEREDDADMSLHSTLVVMRNLHLVGFSMHLIWLLILYFLALL